jgi:hypothetical protein
MEATRLEEDRRVAAERVEIYRRIEAARLAADKARAEQLAAEYLAQDRLIAAERQKAERIEAEKIAAERLKDDVKLELEFAEADRRLDAERHEVDQRVRLQNMLNDAKRLADQKTQQWYCRTALSKMQWLASDSNHDKKLTAEMKRVFAEQFEEKPDSLVSCDKLQEVFVK